MKITYRELLDYVSEGAEPERIKVGEKAYIWNGCDYALSTDCRRSLSNVLSEWTTQAQSSTEFIEILQDILTEKEKEYLGFVISPFRDRIDWIKKANIVGKDLEYIWINLDGCDDCMSLPNFQTGTMYKGMVLKREYTLEELGL